MPHSWFTNKRIRDYKLVVLSILVVLSLFLELTVHWYLGIEVIYSHFFYIPVVLAGIWYGIRGIPVPIFLAGVLLGGTFLVSGTVDPGSALRAFMFVVVGLIVGVISDLMWRDQEKVIDAAVDETLRSGPGLRTVSIGDIKGRIISVAGIKRLKDRQDVPGLVHALRNRDHAVQYAAVEALGELRDPAGIPALMKALTGDQYSGIRWKAAEALGRIGSPAVPSLLTALDNPDPDIRWKAAVTLGEIGDDRAIAPVIKLLGDDDRFVRSRAVYALGTMGPPAVKALSSVLDEGNISARKGAVAALGKIDDSAATLALVHALCDASPEVRQEAASALVTKGKEAFQPILDLLHSPDQVKRCRATEALLGSAADGGKPPLWNALISGDDGCERILQAVISEIEEDEPGKRQPDARPGE